MKWIPGVDSSKRSSRRSSRGSAGGAANGRPSLPTADLLPMPATPAATVDSSSQDVDDGVDGDLGLPPLPVDDDNEEEGARSDGSPEVAAASKIQFRIRSQPVLAATAVADPAATIAPAPPGDPSAGAGAADHYFCGSL